MSACRVKNSNMRVLLCLSAFCVLGVFSSGPLITYTPAAVTASQRIGGSFSYATVESRAAPSIVHSPVIPAPLAVAQPLQSIFGPPFFNPVISSPFYPGVVGQAPVIGQAPIFGQNPVFGQGPIQAPVAPPPQGIPQGTAPPPPGAIVDDDTVSVESA